MGWNAILALFSTALEPSFGAIRLLRTRDGRKVIDSFEDLKHEGKYVACGLEPYKSVKGGYRTKSELEVKMKPSEYYPTQTLSADDQKKYPCLVETMRKGRTIIFVFANGKKSTPRKVVLIKSDYENWNNVIIHIGNILDIPEGVRGLCTIFGQPLCSPYEIQHGGYYVAIPFNTTFKKMKYLPAKTIESYHESSPLVNKGDYISASKTCTSMEDLTGKRRRGKSTSLRDRSEEKAHPRKAKVQHECIGDCSCIEEGVQTSFETEHSEKDHKEDTIVCEDKLTSEELRQQITEETIISSEDMDIIERQVQSADYDQNDIFTQTSALCFESTCAQDNAIIMNEKKFFILTEKQLEQLRNRGLAKRLSNMSSESMESGDFPMDLIQDRDMEEIREVAGNFVGIITKVSEKMIAKTVFGADYISLDSSQDSVLEKIIAKISFIPDTLQPKSASSLESSGEKTKKSAMSKKAKHQTDQALKSLRLSLPIGRGTMNLDDDEIEPEIIPLKRVSLHSPPVEISDSLMEELHEEYKPLTPVRGESMAKEYLTEVKEDLDDDDAPYIPFFGLRRDSIGIPLISKLYGMRKDSIDEDEVEIKEMAALYGENIQEDEPIVDEENIGEDEEWTKLDILEDMNLEVGKDEDGEEEHPADVDEEHSADVEEGHLADVEEEPSAFVKEENGADILEEQKLRKKTSETNLMPTEEISSVQPEITPQEEEDTKISEDISDHSKDLVSDGEEAKLEEDIISEHSKVSSAEVEETKTSEADILSGDKQGSNADTEDTKTSGDIVSDQSQISNEEVRSTETSVDVILKEPVESPTESAKVDEGTVPEQSQSLKSEEDDTNVNGDEDQRSTEEDIDSEIKEEVEPIISESVAKKSVKDVKTDKPKDTKKYLTKSGKKQQVETVSQQSLTSTKGSSSHYYGETDLQAPEKLYGSLLNTSGELALNPDGSIRESSSSELPVLTQKSRIGSYCVTLNSWISMKVEECDEKVENPAAVPSKTAKKNVKKRKNDDKQRSVQTEFEEERRRSLLNFMKMRIEVALSNKVPELRQADKPKD